MELGLNTIQRAGRLVLGHRCPHNLPAPYALQPSPAHQPLNRALVSLYAFSLELLRGHHRAIALHVDDPYMLDFQDQSVIAMNTAAAQFQVTLPCCVPTVPDGGDLQDTLDRRDPEPVTMLIDKWP